MNKSLGANVGGGGDTSSQLVLNNNTHLDYIYMYTGQSYSQSVGKVLVYLNKLSMANKLSIYKRQTSFRDVRILLPLISSNSTNSSSSYTSSSHSSEAYNNTKSGFTIYSKLKRDKSGDNQAGKPFVHFCHEHLEDRNYNTFVYNFNRIALACYLKVLQASKSTWSSYSIDHNMDLNTQFTLINEPDNKDKLIEGSLNDDEFIKSYLSLMIKSHNQILAKLADVFKATTTCAKRNDPATERHVFRSFRILSLRKPKVSASSHHTSFSPTKPVGLIKKGGDLPGSHRTGQHVWHSSKRTRPTTFENNCSRTPDAIMTKNRFCDIIDIRVAFDLRQFQNRTGYDCFIEAEFNYFKVPSNY